MWKMSNGHRIHSNSWDGIRGNWHILLLIYDWLYNMTFIDNQITLGYTIPINAIWVFRYISKIRVHFGFAIKKSQRHRSVNWWDIMIRFDIEHAEWHIVIFSRKSVIYRLSLNAVKPICVHKNGHYVGETSTSVSCVAFCMWASEYLKYARLPRRGGTAREVAVPCWRSATFRRLPRCQAGNRMVHNCFCQPLRQMTNYFHN